MVDRYGRHHRSHRRRRRQNNDDDVPSKISLTEFKFYNTKKNVIEKKVLDNIENEFQKTKEIIEKFTKTEKAKQINVDNIIDNFNTDDLNEIRRYIKKKFKTEIYWTNENFIKYNIGFKFKYHPKRITIKIMDFNHLNKELNKEDKPITEKSSFGIFTVKEFCSLKTIFKDKIFLNFELTELQRTFLYDITNNDYNNTLFDIFKIFNSWDKVLEYMFKYSKMNVYSNDYDSYANIKKILKEFFNVDYDSQQKYKIIKTCNSGIKIYYIEKVIEKRINQKNYRLAVCRYLSYNDEENYRFKLFNENDKEYNYIDEKRVWFSYNKNYFLDSSLNSYDQGKLIINKELIGKMCNNINEILNENQIVITPTIYNFYKNRVSSFDSEDFLTHRETLIVAQYQKLLKQGKKIKFGDIYIKTGEIKILGQNFLIRFNKDFLNTHNNFKTIKSALNVANANYNFNVVYENLLQISIINSFKQLGVSTHFKSVQFKVNTINIKVKRINNRMRINDITCRLSDIYYILTKAICYTNQKEFDMYVKDVSYIGVEWKRMICDGIQINLDNPFKQIFKKTGETDFEDMYMRFSLLWDTKKRSHVYLMLNNQKYLIKYKGQFKKIFDRPSRTISIDKLKDELTNCLVNINEEKIYEIVNNAIEEAKIVQKRGEELVLNTVKDIKAQETEIEIRGNKIYGYYFKGNITQSEYFIEKSSLQVYKKMNGTWNQRCVVDDHTKQRIYEDRLANRLVNIYNEPKKIFTIH